MTILVLKPVTWGSPQDPPHWKLANCRREPAAELRALGNATWRKRPVAAGGDDLVRPNGGPLSFQIPGSKFSVLPDPGAGATPLGPDAGGK